MKGFLFKYDADSADENLKDQFGCVGCGCTRGIRDPDFWSNECPVWAICGPYYRASLQKEDVVFFVPKKRSIRKAGLADYICSGVLVVEEKIPDAKKVMVDDRLTQRYRESYEADLDAHLKNDKPRTRIVRPKNFIIGDKLTSKWLGKHEIYLRQILENLGFHNIKTKLSDRRIPSLNQNQTRQIYDAVLRRS